MRSLFIRKKSRTNQALLYWSLLAVASLSLAIPVAFSADGKTRISQALNPHKYSESNSNLAQNQRSQGNTHQSIQDRYSRERVIVLERQIAALQSNLESLQNTIGNVNSQTNAVRMAYSEATARLDQVENKYQSITGSINQLTNSQNRLAKSQSKEIERLIANSNAQNRSLDSTRIMADKSKSSTTMSKQVTDLQYFPPQRSDTRTSGRKYASLADPKTLDDRMMSRNINNTDNITTGSVRSSTSIFNKRLMQEQQASAEKERVTAVQTILPDGSLAQDIMLRNESGNAQQNNGSRLNPILDDQSNGSAFVDNIPSPTIRPRLASDSQQAQRVASSQKQEGKAPEPLVLRTDFGVILARDSNINILKDKWNQTKNSLPELMQGLTPKVRIEQSANTGAIELTLMAGPIKNAADAAQICGALQSEIASCRPAIFSGHSLLAN